jgi:hypothetical protein
MAHDRNMPKKPARKPKTKDKKHKGLPPHLQRPQSKDTIHDIQTYVDTVAKRQSDQKGSGSH